MARRKKQAQAASTACAHWKISDHFVANNRHLSPGIEVKIHNEKGRFKFERHVINGDVEWIDVRDKDGRFRSFRPDRIRTVHIKQRLR